LGFDYFIDHHSDRELAHAGALKVKRILSKDWGCITNTRRQFNGARIFGIWWPPLPELRAKFEAKYGKQQWLHPDENEWRGAMDDGSGKD
jgi:hypothetical protein